MIENMIINVDWMAWMLMAFMSFYGYLLYQISKKI